MNMKETRVKRKKTEKGEGGIDLGLSSRGGRGCCF